MDSRQNIHIRVDGGSPGNEILVSGSVGIATGIDQAKAAPSARKCRRRGCTSEQNTRREIVGSNQARVAVGVDKNGLTQRSTTNHCGNQVTAIDQPAAALIDVHSVT